MAPSPESQTVAPRAGADLWNILKAAGAPPSRLLELPPSPFPSDPAPPRASLQGKERLPLPTEQPPCLTFQPEPLQLSDSLVY